MNEHTNSVLAMSGRPFALICERGRNGEGGRSVSQLVILTSTARIISQRYHYYWWQEQNKDRSQGFTVGQTNPVLGSRTCPTWHCPTVEQCFFSNRWKFPLGFAPRLIAPKLQRRSCGLFRGLLRFLKNCFPRHHCHPH